MCTAIYLNLNRIFPWESSQVQVVNIDEDVFRNGVLLYWKQKSSFSPNISNHYCTDDELRNSDSKYLAKKLLFWFQHSKIPLRSTSSSQSNINFPSLYISNISEWKKLERKQNEIWKETKWQEMVKDRVEGEKGDDDDDDDDDDKQ